MRLYAGLDRVLQPDRLDRRLVGAEDPGKLVIAESGALQRPQHVARDAAQPDEARRTLQLDDLRELHQEPLVDFCQVVQLFDRPAAVERPEHRPHAALVGHAQFTLERAFLFFDRQAQIASAGILAEQQAAGAELERVERLHEGFLERPPDRHHFSDRLHLCRQRAVGAGELLERPARHLDDDVVDGRLEGRRREPGDVVGDLVERVAEGELGGNLRDRESGRLRRQRRRPRHARVHLDHDDAAVGRVDRELDVRAAGLDADAADDAAAEVAHALIFAIGQGQRRGDGDAVAGMHAHRIDVLDRADDDEVVGAVAHHLELVLLPADDRLLDQDLVHRAQLDAAPGQLPVFLDVVGDPAADAAERERRADDDREPDHLRRGDRLFHRADVRGSPACRSRSPASRRGT